MGTVAEEPLIFNIHIHEFEVNSQKNINDFHMKSDIMPVQNTSKISGQK